MILYVSQPMVSWPSWPWNFSGIDIPVDAKIYLTLEALEAEIPSSG